ncbi:hypothetical protein AVEN_131070-1 [Araneus ventricosus]|uniref:Uncharacterized protein n=1 Tax=Araneus ventricosus TaxID=182803 RepID=A0A4Y2D0W1_ARAVE|nr:hypothetical protein AVEN_131070-1 [Araneus ventricosus]
MTTILELVQHLQTFTGGRLILNIRFNMHQAHIHEEPFVELCFEPGNIRPRSRELATKQMARIASSSSDQTPSPSPEYFNHINGRSFDPDGFYARKATTTDTAVVVTKPSSTVSILRPSIPILSHQATAALKLNKLRIP